MKPIFVFMLILGMLPSRLLAQPDLSHFKQLFLANDYDGLFDPLLRYVSSLNGRSSFEADYMMGVTLCNAGYEKDGRAYLLQTENKFPAPSQIFNGHKVSLQNAIDNCTLTAGVATGGPQPSGPGVQAIMKQTVDWRTQPQILNSVRTEQSRKQLVLNRQGTLSRAATVSPAIMSANIHDGAYSIVHDGWKGQLILKGAAGEYIDGSGKRFPVRVQFVPDHKVVFYVVGLGGENANGMGGQKFEGYFFTQTKDGMAGTTWWQNQPFGFYAVRK